MLYIIKHQSFVYKQWNNQTVLFLTIQFSMSFVYKQFKCKKNSFWPIEDTVLHATTPSQSGPGGDGTERVLRIHEISILTGTSPSDCLVSYQDTRGSLTPLQRCTQCILRTQPTGLKLFVSNTNLQTQNSLIPMSKV